MSTCDAMRQSMTLASISDTALWVAACRAMETSRPDALFRDLWAERLAGERGRRIAESMAGARDVALEIAVRTEIFDALLRRVIRREKADVVVDLAAGLDTRAWRLPLPPELRWIDVDLQHVLEHKTSLMQHDRPSCRYETIALDLRDRAARDDMLARIAAHASRALVITEGLLIYFTPDEVTALAQALHAHRCFRWWILDLISPTMLGGMQLLLGRKMQRGRAPFQFAPAEGTGFFAELGWFEAEHHASVEQAHLLRRANRLNAGLRLLGRVFPGRREQIRRAAGVALLIRNPTP